MKLVCAMSHFFYSTFPALTRWGRRDNPTQIRSGLLIVASGLLVTSTVSAADLRPGEIVTVLPKDAIPAIMSPTFDGGATATWLRDRDLVVGVIIKGDSRAYPVAILSRHEIINDKSGVLPFAVTW